MWWSSWLELLDTSPEQPLGFLTSSQGFIMAGCSFFTPLPSWVAPLLFLPALLKPPHPHITSPSGTGEQNRNVFMWRGCGRAIVHGADAGDLPTSTTQPVVPKPTFDLSLHFFSVLSQVRHLWLLRSHLMSLCP